MSLKQATCADSSPFPHSKRGILEQGAPYSTSELNSQLPHALGGVCNLHFPSTWRYQSPHLEHMEQGSHAKYCFLFSSFQLRQKCYLGHKETNPAIVLTSCQTQKEHPFLAIIVY